MQTDLKQTLALILANQAVIMEYIDEHSQMDIIIRQTKQVAINLTKVVPKKEMKPIKNLKDVNDIYNFWNGSGIIKHQVIADHSSAIQSALKNYSVGNIICAIDNFSTVCNSDEYHNYSKRPLKDFLRNYLLKFIDSAKPLDNYKVNNGRKNNQSAIITNEDQANFTSKFN